MRRPSPAHPTRSPHSPFPPRSSPPASAARPHASAAAPRHRHGQRRRLLDRRKRLHRARDRLPGDARGQERRRSTTPSAPRRPRPTTSSPASRPTSSTSRPEPDMQLLVDNGIVSPKWATTGAGKAEQGIVTDSVRRPRRPALATRSASPGWASLAKPGRPDRHAGPDQLGQRALEPPRGLRVPDRRRRSRQRRRTSSRTRSCTTSSPSPRAGPRR